MKASTFDFFLPCPASSALLSAVLATALFAPEPRREPGRLGKFEFFDNYSHFQLLFI